LEATRGDPVAMSGLAYLLAHPGRASHPKLVEAERLAERAARAGEPAGLYRAYVRLSKIGRTRQAMIRLKESARLGLTESLFLLGYAMITGQHTKKDRRQGLRLLERSYDQGHKQAAGVIGCELDGSTKMQQAAAARWYAKGARRGDALAMLNLAVAYEHGEGVRRNRNAALRWYRKAAALGRRSAVQAVRRLSR
jgi:uncharacterized protein